MDRRAGEFNEKLAIVLVIGGILGAMLVLIDPVLTITMKNGVTLHLGGTGFSDQLKGAVVSMILVSGFANAVAFYFGSSNSDKMKNQTINTLASTNTTTETKP